MDECDGLENRWGRKLLVGSNPTPSAMTMECRSFQGVPPALTAGRVAHGLLTNPPSDLWIERRGVSF